MKNQMNENANAAFRPVQTLDLTADRTTTGPMAGRPHKVSAIYPTHAEAEGVRHSLIEMGFAASAVDILHELPAHPAPSEDSDEVLKEVLVDGAIGTAVGTGVGAVGTVALVAANVTLFVASPVLAPLAMLGWFAGLGGVVGAMVGAAKKEGKFSELVTDAIKAGNAILVVETRTQAETDLAKHIITASLKGRDMSAMESS